MLQLSELITSRLPRRPYCTDNLDSGLIVRPASVASGKRYLQLNPPILRHWIVFDIDNPMAALAWETANLPAPNWISVNPTNTHAHIGYLLELPVITASGAHDKPLRYAAAIETAFRLALRADASYSGFISKNPLNAIWKTWYLHAEAYSLEQLAEWVNLPRCRTAQLDPIGLGRNVMLFDALRHWAYGMVLHYKNAESGPDMWFRAVLHEADGLNQRFSPPLFNPEVKATAKSIAKWTWRRFTATQFSIIQRARATRRWSKVIEPSLEETKPWIQLGISRRSYFNRKKEGLVARCTDAISDTSG